MGVLHGARVLEIGDRCMDRGPSNPLWLPCIRLRPHVFPTQLHLWTWGHGHDARARRWHSAAARCAGRPQGKNQYDVDVALGYACGAGSLVFSRQPGEAPMDMCVVILCDSAERRNAWGRAVTIPICILLGLRPLPPAPLEDLQAAGLQQAGRRSAVTAFTASESWITLHACGRSKRARHRRAQECAGPSWHDSNLFSPV